MELKTLRLDLARAKSRLRIAQDNFKFAQANAEQLAVDVAGGSKNLGSNAEDRARALILALEKDVEYRDELKKLQAFEYQVDGIEALIADAIDERKRQEMIVRDKMADALMWNVGADVPSGPDDAFDDALAQVSEETLDAIRVKCHPNCDETGHDPECPNSPLTF